MHRDSDLIHLAKAIAETFKLPPELVCAVCEQESSWNPLSTRFEPLFQVRYIDKLNLDPQESLQRSTSWGLMQLMGESARELGYSGELPKLLDPETCLAWGCRHLETRLAHAEGNTVKALLLWNGGGNPHYADQVLARMNKYKETTNRDQ